MTRADITAVCCSPKASKILVVGVEDERKKKSVESVHPSEDPEGKSMYRHQNIDAALWGSKKQTLHFSEQSFHPHRGCRVNYTQRPPGLGCKPARNVCGWNFSLSLNICNFRAAVHLISNVLQMNVAVNSLQKPTCRQTDKYIQHTQEILQQRV